MSSQIFKTNVPNEVFFSFIESIKSNNDDTNMIVINNDSYKRSTLKMNYRIFG